MKLSILALLLVISLDTSACDQPIELKTGAFFNSATNANFWGDYIKNLSAKLDCPVKLRPSPSFESFIDDLINEKGDMYVIPEHYAQILIEQGYIPVLRSTTPIKVYLLTQKKYDPSNLDSLKNKTIYVPSIYSISYHVLKGKIESSVELKNIKFEFGRTYQSNLMSVLKGDMDATVIFSPAFDNLPNKIKNKVHISTIYETDSIGYIMVKPSASKSLIKAIQSSHSKINILKWASTDKILKKNFIGREFKKQYVNIQKEGALQKTMPIKMH